MMTPLTKAYVLLIVAIATEVVGSTFLAKSDGFTRALPTMMTVSFILAFIYYLR